jgi:phospholipid/cholesterol/gamma-HCH transport system permease protein
LRPGPALTLERRGGAWHLALHGDWSLGSLAQIEQDLHSLDAPLDAPLICDWTQATEPGIAPAWALLTRIARLNGAGFAVSHAGEPEVLALLSRLAAERGDLSSARQRPAQEGALGALGRWTLEQGVEARGAVGFFGRMVTVIGETFSRPRALRVSSIVRHVYETGITAVPIVSLIAFLISVVVAYLGAQQLSRFGADIFVVDLITISVLREMGVLLTAIVVAGRSGSAFAAELGVMRLNEETDALRAMGMNPIEVLVLPRVIGLVIALPLLTVVADAMGLAGGGLLSLVNLHIPLPQFTGRLRESLAPTTFWAGLVKAPVFAVLIGMVGTYRGMQVRDSARELGRLTTVAVVQSIFMVILADALFAVLFMKLDF